MLVGRGTERRRVEDLLEDARRGRSGTLVLVGEPGIGKTALLDHAARVATGFRILRARGIQSEAQLPFGALLDLCRPVLQTLAMLEQNQADALRSSFGMQDGRSATPFAIGAATLSFLAAVAEDRPLLLVVDDAHWLDRGTADALAFAVRRLRADAVAAFFATRPGEGRPFGDHDLPELELGALDPESAATLLARALDDHADPAAEQTILEVARGNPLALLELPRARPRAETAAEPVRIGKRLERAFTTRADALPKASRLALVVAAVATTGDLAVLHAALARLGVPMRALERAEVAGLVALERGAVEFRHPLVRSALYHAAEPAERRRAHAAVAAALADDDDRRAWHLAAAAVGPDPRAADALERAAATASERSGFAAAAAAYERAARLSEGAEDRIRRLTAAADAAWLGGRTAHALALVEEALPGTQDAEKRGHLLHMRGTIEHFTGDFARAHRTLEEAANLLAAVNRLTACVSLNAAVGSSLLAGEIERAVFLSERICALVDATQLDQQLFVFSRAACLIMAGRPSEARPFLRRTAAALDDASLLADDPRHLTWAALAAFWLGDVERMASNAGHALEWAREHAAVATLANAARLVARAQLVKGHWTAARASLAESLEAAGMSGQATQEVDTLSVLAWLDAAQGRAEECRRHVERGLQISEDRRFRWRNELVRALVFLDLGLGVDEQAPGIRLLRRTLADGSLLRETPASAAVPDLVEALTRLGDVGQATALLAPFADEAEQLGQPLPRALALRCRALLADEGSYDRWYHRSLELHALDANVFALARTRLSYGERLRRSGRRIDARAQLREALPTFEALDAAPWIERTHTELRATGERIRKRDLDARDELTPQELQVAALVAEGKTNREVGAQLFLSPKTIEWHLGHVYRKLGVRSRAELARAIGTRDAAPA